MTAPETMTTNCPTEETLAVFIDGRLDDEARRRVIEHAAECAECRDILLTAAEIQNADATNVAPFRPRQRMWPLIAVAASLVVVFGLPATHRWWVFQRTGGLSAVVAAHDQISQRTVEPRLTGGFAHKDYKDVTRGDESVGLDADQVRLLHAAADLEERGADSWKELRALAIGYLLTGDREKALVLMKRAAAQAPNEPTVLSDLAALYLHRGDMDEALPIAARAWTLAKTPETAFNRALALERAGRDADAIRAWDEYLALDASSAWADEARDHLTRLRDGG
jgi:hypothetical protein